MPMVGYRFIPTDEELLLYYLYNKITENPELYADGPLAVIDGNLYGSDVPEPSKIWTFYGGDQLLVNPSLYFFTPLKKLSPTSSRFSRKVASGSWHGGDAETRVHAHGRKDQLLGFKRTFKYRSDRNSADDGRWIMHEFTINPYLLPEQHSDKALNFALCCIKRNDRKPEQAAGKDKLVKNLGKTNPARKKHVTGKATSGGKRKLEQAMSPTNNVDTDRDDLSQKKRFRAEREDILVSYNTSSDLCTSLQTISTAAPSASFHMEGFMSNWNQIRGGDFAHGGDDQGIRQNQAMPLPCIRSITHIAEPRVKIESLPNDLDTFDIAVYSSMLEQILEHDCTEDLNVEPALLESGAVVESVPDALLEIREHWSQVDQPAQPALLAQQNKPMDLPCDNILQTVESGAVVESLPEAHLCDMDPFLSYEDVVQKSCLYNDDTGELPEEYCNLLIKSLTQF